MPRKKQYNTSPKKSEYINLKRLGFEAGRLGNDSDENPYFKGNPFHSAWYAGWVEGATEFVTANGYVLYLGSKLYIYSAQTLVVHGFSNRQAGIIYQENKGYFSSLAGAQPRTHIPW